MRKLDQVTITKAILDSQGDPEKLAQLLGVSKSHAYYLLRNKRAGISTPVINTSAPVAPALPTPAPTAPAPTAPVQEKKIILRTDVDTTAFIPPVDPQYKLRDYDADIEKYSERGDFATVLVGEAGSGKTYAVQQYSARKGLPFLRVACDDSVALRSLLGSKEIKQGTTFFKYGLLLEFLQIPSVILFDEFNCIPSGKLFFLHEILDKMTDGRRVFVKEADTVIKMSEHCKILLACNPSTSRYSGTNKLNVALGDRPRIINFEPFKVSEVKELFDCGKPEVTASLKNYYTEARKLINASGMRAVFSLRSIKRIAQSISQGDSVAKALEHNFYNMTLLTASEAEREQLQSLAKVCFGLDTMSQGSAEVKL